MDQEYIEFEDCKLIAQTEKAGLFESPDWDEQQWLPWSQISDDSPTKNGETGTLSITEWICKQKGIEY